MAQHVVFISAAVTEELLQWPAMIAGLRHAYSAPHNSHTSFRAVARGEGAWLRSLVSIPPTSQFMGAKIFGRTTSRQVTYLVPLFDRISSELVALVDGRHLTARRTAATSAVAVDRLFSQKALRLGVLGSGGEARSHVEAISHVRKIERLAVYSPSASKRQQFAQHFAETLGIPCIACEDAQAVVTSSNLIVAAARSRDETPIINGEWLESGSLLVSIGSTIPEQRELDVKSIERCDLIVCDMLHEVRDETGDFIAAKSQGVALNEKLVTLNELIMGAIDDRVSKARLPMYKSVGAAVQDVTVAEIAYVAALKAGCAADLGFELDIHHV